MWLRKEPISWRLKWNEKELDALPVDKQFYIWNENKLILIQFALYVYSTILIVIIVLY